MNSVKVFNDAICYLESIIPGSSEIDYIEISKIVMSPAALFQRIFIYVSGVSINEYVRKRRLTLAGQDLKNRDGSVLEIAVKYGFQSHSAFTRAFKEQHGITPSQAGSVWQDFFNGETVPKLNALSEFKDCDDIDENDGIGFMYGFEGKENFDIIIGNLTKTSTQIPDDLFAKHVAGGLTAHIQIEGNNIADILDCAYLLITEAIEKTGKQIDYDNFYWCEVYTHERYCRPLSKGEKVTIDYIMPVKGSIVHE